MRGAKRLGVLVIADEVLGGHVHESNAHWVAKQAKPMGIELARIEVCSDRLEDIVASVRRFCLDLGLDYVITSGGLGPTPDDRTMEGIGAALGLPLEARPEHVQWMRDRTAFGHKLGYFQSAEPNAGMMKMTRLPQGAGAIPNEVGTALGAIVEVDVARARASPDGRAVPPAPMWASWVEPAAKVILFTLPGVPREFYRMFDQGVRPRLEASAPIHSEELVLFTEESRLFETLARLEKAYPDVVLGSYPEVGQIRIRATGEEARAKALIEDMRQAAAQYLTASPEWLARKSMRQAMKDVHDPPRT